MVVAYPDSGNRAGKSWIVLAYTVTADQLINFSCRNVTSCVNFGFPNTYIHVAFSFLWAVVEPNALYVNCSFALPLEMRRRCRQPPQSRQGFLAYLTWRSCSRVSQRASVRVEILLGFAGGCWVLSSDQHRVYQKRQTSLLVWSKRKKLWSSYSRYTTDYKIVFETKKECEIL